MFGSEGGKATKQAGWLGCVLQPSACEGSGGGLALRQQEVSFWGKMLNVWPWDQHNEIRAFGLHQPWVPLSDYPGELQLWER